LTLESMLDWMIGHLGQFPALFSSRIGSEFPVRNPIDFEFSKDTIAHQPCISQIIT